MPAFLTHYSCGIVSYNEMEHSALKEDIAAHKTVYDLGLAGPDPFFYSAGEAIRKGKNIGSVMHTDRTGRFLRALYAETLRFKGDDRRCANAYLAGFLGHYALDCTCHPYVYKQTKTEGRKAELGKHYRLEAAMDVFSCRYILKKDIRDSHQLSLVRLRANERNVIAQMLSRALEQTWENRRMRPGKLRLNLLLIEYYLLTGVLFDPTGFKEWLVTRHETRKYGYTYMAALMINRNRYGFDPYDWQEFRTHFDKGVESHKRLLAAFDATLADRAQAADLFDAIGNRSYHDGRELEEEDG